ncbi:MAG: pilus assembly protein PilM [Thermodesulfobacteriota bacterium]|nr:pilus assembly protein PilM [Thermodesulfobacteriota bacterium]
MLFQTSLGIDIENESVSMAYLRTSFKGVRLKAHVVHPLDREQSAKERLGRVRELVKDFLEKNNISSTDIFLGIPRDLAILRTIELPLAVKENLRESLGYEIDKYVPFSVDDINFDYQIISEDRQVNRLKILLVVVRKESIDPYLELRNGLGDGISGIEISSTAMVNYFSSKPNTPDENAYALVYLRTGDLELNLVEKGLLNYSRSVGLAETGGNFSDHILQELKPFMEDIGPDQGRLKVVLCGPDADIERLTPLGEMANLDVRAVDLAGGGISSMKGFNSWRI